ncbi:MAG: restriction endonuclease subunit S [Clostridia bacterium]|nr:restriction endonuclease subunit S [Clostridia bacterium]
MDENQKIPRIRFKGFTDTWEQCKLGDCFDERQERSAEGELISVTINDGIKKFAELGRHDNSSDDKSHYKVVEVGDIAYNSMRMWQGASGYSPYKGILSPAYTVLVPKENINAQFFAYLFKRPVIIHLFQISSQGITSDTWNLKFPSLSEIETKCPKGNEQELIATCFKELDNLITLHQRKYDKLVSVKKSLLEKMFPADGETVPKIRFKGFTDPWEQRKLKDFAEYTASSLTAKDCNENGRFDLYDANSLIGKTDAMHMSCDYITIIKDGAGVGRTRILPKNTAFIGTMGALNEKNSDFNFLFAVLNKVDWENKYSGSTIPHIYFKDYGEDVYNIPINEEQHQIGAFFLEIDNLITLHQRKLDKLKNIKKSLLEKMFV